MSKLQQRVNKCDDQSRIEQCLACQKEECDNCYEQKHNEAQARYYWKKKMSERHE